MAQPWMKYVIVVLIVGLVIGSGIGWAVKPVPPEYVAKTELDKVNADLTKVKADLDKLRTDYNKLKADYDALLKAGLTGEILIGGLHPLTGDLATYGQNSKVAAEFAAEEINALLKATGAKWTLKIVTEDTETKPDVCLEKVKSLAAKGIKFMVGPMSSGEIRNIKGYCDANKILTISQSSTAPALGVPGDFIFRFCPNDAWQGRAIARLLYADGIRYVVAAWRGDAWGDGLEDAAEKRFSELGGNFTAKVRYAPEAKEFSAEAKALSDAVSSAVAKYGRDKVGVYFIAFEEVVIFFSACKEYTVLTEVKWYGSDGTVQSAAMLGDKAVAAFSVKTKFKNPIFTPVETAKFYKVRDKVKAVLGRVPDSYAYSAYDIVWALAYSLMTVDKYDSEAVRAVLPDVVKSLLGASGWVMLDANGDRAPTDYDIWVIVETTPGVYDWKLISKWILDTDSIKWL